MKTSRRSFLRKSALSASLLGALPALAAPASRAPSFVTRKPTMHIGMVTYNLAQDWDVDTIIKNCQAAQFEGVELRTSHAHKVEVNLSKEDRASVRDKFRNSDVQLMGLGSAFDYHTPDQQKLKKDIADTKEYITLAHDVGAGGVKVRPNGFPKDVSKEKTLEQIGRSLKELGDFGDSLGIKIRLEVHGPGTSLVPNIKTIMDVADHKNVGVCWNSNQTDLEGKGFDDNFNLVKDKIFSVHMRDLYLEEYPFRKLLTRLNEIQFDGFCLAEIPASKDPVRVMQYFRALWLAYQGVL
ncbi:MAG TPA: sugar phosphate isomerase/epimerase family protein [Candidatus Saccharimonadales bacterium]|nr:sugar phosphate isomerase/epimerase family protein [Candidatus Saccharimonadales bacterium]